ncbi:MAG: hypothetical protein A2Y33_11825 [Spirochaetes bacterium GWF1_51_8]|nr:MAG: hypothetical protein A2Y33_11825 [Spirochaetes bacterium GWF1_51_8]
MKKTVFILLAMVILGVNTIFAATAKIKPTTIAGFINKGDKADDKINVMLTKSLINLLSKIPSVVITPYEDVEAAVKDNKLWTAKTVDIEKSLAMGLLFETKQVVVGDYHVTGGKVTINLSIYDVVTGELSLQRSFKDRPAGADIFSTIDDVVKQVSYILVGKAIALGKVKVMVDVPENLYKVYVNGRFEKEIKKGEPYTGEIIAGEPVEVSIRLMVGKEEKEVFKKAVMVEEGKTAEVMYEPSGTIMIKAFGMPGSKVYLNDAEYGSTDENGDITIFNLPAGKEQKIKLEVSGKVYGEKTGSVKEGDNLLMVFGATDKKFLIPITIGRGALIGGSVGFTYMFSQNFWAGVNLGMCYLPTPAQAVFMFDVNAFFPIIRMGDFMFGAGVSAFFFVPGTVSFSPLVELSVSYASFFVNIGARYSLESPENFGGLKPIVGIGYRF